MKIFSKILLFITLLGLWLSSIQVNASLSDFLDSSSPSIGICQWDDCGIQQWVDVLKGNLNDVETEQKASEYIQNIIVYLIGFISIIAVIYIIYAWFNILTGTGDEEKIKKSKWIIMYVVIWLIVIYLAYSIVAFVFNVFDSTSTITFTEILNIKNII